MRTFFNLLLLILIAAGALYWDAGRLLKTPLPLQQAESLEIAPGSSLTSILNGLQARNIVQPPRLALYLRLYARFTGVSALIKAGEYELAPGINPLDMLALLVEGKTRLHTLLIVEGRTFAQALKLLREHPAIRQTRAQATAEELMAAIGRAGVHPEGRLFPDTYNFPKGTTDVAFLQHAAEAMDKALAQEWEAREADLPYASPEEALTMASIIEKETGAVAERPEIGGVFVRRLRLGMRLQTDPTIIYGLGEAFDGNIRRADLLADNPYNSYTRDGLPPSPICLPSRAAIHAALHPAPGSAIYFVSKGDGTHQFSDTLAEHEAAVRRYQLGRP
ncbi:endolytic transglycosylase MltG [Solimonas sp. K1W22B-7]|uniref:endolytic transglycosylase MltG n=1 Tax=Solimonas sp. K1W22B-7 TaxID=2303331 RepID=UPI000E335644|nr:endolytic transglycosylase MltG [Solimonas sp. K1W22B-7]AXQ29433.1 endolytic transglycosylase MltG [Solimonas sp. K1W22B-7]